MAENTKKNLTVEDFVEAAELLKCEVEVIKAVANVEAPKGGFLPDGRPVILFESHIFYKQLKFAGINPENYINDPDFKNIITRKWDKSKYLGLRRLDDKDLTPDIDNEYERFNVAQTLNNEAAIKSCSWGKFQVMAFNYKPCGYNNLWDFIGDIQKTEREHLIIFCKYIMNRGLDKYLREKNFTKFAYYYNGKGFAENKYDSKMEEEYLEIKKFLNEANIHNITLNSI